MKILFFDTETTGLAPKSKELSYTVLDKWPHVVQFSYLIYDNENEKNPLIKTRDHIMKLPATIQMDQENIQIHGITNEMSQKKGIDFEKIMEEVVQDFQSVHLIVAHNLEFDLNLLKVEMMRKILNCQLSDSLFTRIKTRSKNKNEKTFDSFLKLLQTNRNYFCTMQESVDLCNIKKTNSMGEYLKFPKLCELHSTLLQTEPKNLHNSLNDVLICMRCFYKLKYGEDIREKNPKIKKMIDLLL